jgi:hypothetical protein
MELYLRKLPGGAMVADNDETTEALSKVKVGTVLRGEFKRPRNYKFLKKCHSLAGLAFEHFCEHLQPIEYKGEAVAPDYDSFRKDMTILAGFYSAEYKINGAVRLRAMSWSFANTSEEQMNKIYSGLINVALGKIYKGSISEEQLNNLVAQIMEYA